MESDVSVIVANDRSCAELCAPAGLDPAAVNAERLAAKLRESKVVIDREVIAEVEKFAADYAKLPEGEMELRRVVARAIAPVKGSDGRIEWAQGCDPASLKSVHASASSGDRSQKVDHYAGKKYIAVSVGSVIGKLIPATDGTPGRDVLGKETVIRGSPCSISFDNSVVCEPSGQITSKINGILALEHKKLSVVDQIKIPDYVDFSTGHVDFPGDVRIVSGVRSGFKVHSGKNLVIGGLVEVAEISCDGDLELSSGMAGKHKGTLLVSGNAKVGYLEAVTGVVKHTLTVEREIGDCKLTVGGDLKAANATIMGGDVAVTGSCIVKVIGAESGTQTKVHLGDIPLLHGPRQELRHQIEGIDTKMKQLAGEEQLIMKLPRPSAREKERLTEIVFEKSELEKDRKRKAEKLEEIDKFFAANKKLDLRVTKVIHRNVTITIADHTVTFRDDVKGPLHIFWDANHQIVYRVGSGEARSLSLVAVVMKTSQAVGHRAAA